MLAHKNLNDLHIVVDGGINEPLQDFSTREANPYFDSIEVAFKNIEPKLISLISEYRKGFIFGCVAWLTSKPVLTALAKCDNVQIILQKEDFLRPDVDIINTTAWTNEIRNLYSSLKCSYNRFECLEPIENLSQCDDPTVAPIRCVGNYNETKSPAFARSHHKFLVFCRIDENRKYLPEVVWTGSFNLTKTATRSFDNVIILTDKSGDNSILTSFVKEHHQIFALSEQLNWEHSWVAPEFRIGT